MLRLLLDVSAVPARPAGAGVYVQELARHLARRPTVDLTLLARRDDAMRWHDIAPAARVLAAAPSARPVRLAWEQLRAPRIAADAGVDLWHGPHYTMPLQLPVPAVVTVHDLTFFDHPELHEYPKVAFFRPATRASMRRAAAVVTVSKFTRERLCEVAPPRGPVRVVLHGVDHERFRTDADADADRAQLAHHGIREPYVAFVGTHEPRKNLPLLVASFARLARERKDLKLVLAGSAGWGADQLREAIRASGCATRILRPGYLPDASVAPLLRRAAVVAYPSREEGFGLPVLEALACGAPLVTTEGSAPEEATGTKAAILVPPDDADALTDALRRALEPDTARLLRAAGVERTAKFTWEATVDAHLEVYRIAATGRAIPAEAP